LQLPYLFLVRGQRDEMVYNEQYQKQYRQTHKEERNEYNRQYRREHPENRERTRERWGRWLEKPGNREKAREGRRKWRYRHKEQIREYKLKYRQENGDTIALTLKKYRSKHWDEILDYQRKYDKTETGRKINRRRSRRRRSKLRSMSHTLTDTDCNEIVDYFESECSYCGETIHEFGGNINTMITWDRINNDFGYDRGNTIIARHSCNSSKHSSDLLDWYPMQPFYTKERLKKIYDEMEAHPIEYNAELRKRIKKYLETH